MALARHGFFVMNCADPARNARRACRVEIKPKDVKVAIVHAQNICFGHEDTAACKVAWDRVEDLSTGLAKQMERKLLLKNMAEVMCEEDPAACREYDV